MEEEEDLDEEQGPNESEDALDDLRHRMENIDPFSDHNQLPPVSSSMWTSVEDVDWETIQKESIPSTPPSPSLPSSPSSDSGEKDS